MSLQPGYHQLASLCCIDLAYQIIRQLDNILHIHVRGAQVAEDILQCSIDLLQRVFGHGAIFPHPHLTGKDQYPLVARDLNLMRITTQRLVHILWVSKFFHESAPV